MAQERQAPSSLQHLISRIDRLANPERAHLQMRVQRVQTYMADFAGRPYRATIEMGNIEHLLSRSSSSERREEFEDVVLAHYCTRLQTTGVMPLSQFPQQEPYKKGDAESVREHITLREDQIEGIIDCLQGSHIQADTGWGKTAFVLPLTALVKARTQPNEPVVITEPTPELKVTMYAHLQRIAECVIGEKDPRVSLFIHRGGETYAGDEEERYTKQLLQNIIQGQEVDSFVREHFFSGLFSTNPSYCIDTRTGVIVQRTTGDTSTIAAIKSTISSGVAVFLESEAVFDTQSGGKASILADEADVPAVRGTSYEARQGAMLTPERAESYLYERILTGYVNQLLSQGLIQDKPGKGWGFVGEKETLQFDKQTAFLLEREDPFIGAALRRSIQTVAGSLDMDPQQVEAWFQKKHSLLFRSTSREERHDLLSDIYMGLIEARNLRKGVDYISQTGRIDLRDSYLGLELQGHEYRYRTMMCSQAIEGVVNPLLSDTSSYFSISYPGWIRRNSVQALSGTLLQRSLSRPHVQKETAFSRFIEEVSGKPVGTYAKPGVKEHYVPLPIDVPTDEKGIEEMILAVQKDNKHTKTVIFCFDERDLEQIAAVFRQRIPQSRIEVVSADLDEREANKVYERFANTSQQVVLLSAGRATQGIDLKDAGGSFTDHTTYFFGIPEHTTQIHQGVGRRRKESLDPKNEFRWFFSDEQLRRYPAYRMMSKEERERWKKRYSQSPLEAMDALIQRATGLSYESLAFQATYDRFFQAMGKRLYQKMEQTAKRVFETNLPEIQKGFNLSETDLRIAQRFFSQILGQSIEDYFVDFVGIPSEWPARLMSLPQTPGSSTHILAQFNRNFDDLLSDEEQFVTWSEGKLADFSFFLSSVIVPQLKANKDLYDRLARADDVTMRQIGLVEADNQTLRTLPPGEHFVRISEEENAPYVYVYRPSELSTAIVALDLTTAQLFSIPYTEGLSPRGRILMGSPETNRYCFVSWTEGTSLDRSS